MVTLTSLIAALIVAALLAALPSCKKSGDAGSQGAETTSSLPPATDAQPGGAAGSPGTPGAEAGDAATLAAGGQDAYTAGNCSMCHGANREGGKLGPALAKLSVNWDKDKLVRYLADPEGYKAQDSRLSADAKKYPMNMPRPRLTDEQLAALAAWLMQS
jgi:mono/diheme cytochrome c family protein